MTQVTVREHARLTLDPVAPNLDHATIGQTALDYLCDLQARAGAGSSLLKLEGGRSVKLVNYVGVIETPCGTRIEILPKHADHDTDPATARRVLRRMLLDSLDLNPRSTDEASIELHRLPLTEWVIRRFLKELDYLVKRGIRFDYVRVEEEQRFLRGQWDIARQMRQPPGRDHIFQLRHDVYLPDRPENRLLRTALDRTCRATSDPDNWRLSHELALRMNEVPVSSNIHADFAAWRADRMMLAYGPVQPWCRLVLGQEMPLALQGGTRGMSMLFPMERVYERHVAAQLRRQLLPGAKLTAQAASESLCIHQDQPMFRLQPDLLFQRGGTRWVMDTKWKRVDAARRGDNYDLSQGDIYQMFAYGQKYLNGQGTMALVYPRTATFDAPLPVFQLVPGLDLWVLPFDLTSGRLVLPEGLGAWPVVGGQVEAVHKSATAVAV